MHSTKACAVAAGCCCTNCGVERFEKVVSVSADGATHQMLCVRNPLHARRTATVLAFELLLF